MQIIKLSESTANERKLGFLAASDTTGARLDASTLTFTVRIVKADGSSDAGGGSGGIGAGVSQPDVTNARGACHYAGVAADYDELGLGIAVVSAPGMETVEIPFQVVAYDPYDATALGISRLDAAITSRASASDMSSVIVSLARILGLCGENTVIDGGDGAPSPVFGTSNLMTVWRIRTFASKAATDAATLGAADDANGETYRWTGTTTDLLDEGKWSLLRRTRSL